MKRTLFVPCASGNKRFHFFFHHFGTGPLLSIADSCQALLCPDFLCSASTRLISFGTTLLLFLFYFFLSFQIQYFTIVKEKKSIFYMSG
jgi:hypothetical protein